MRITRRGVLVLAAAPLLAALAWLLGLPEAAVLGTGAVVTVVVSWLWVATHRPRLDVRRSARPARCAVGAACQIQLLTRNRSARRSPVVVLTDHVGLHGTAELHLGPLAPGAQIAATYSLPTQHRGWHRVGPLSVRTEDPFALVRATLSDAACITVIVLPRTWVLAPLPPAPGDEPEQGVRALASLSTVDEEFSALRAYVPGDDIRRIHWPTTARTGSPVMRQFDLPWQHRTTVVVDLQGWAHDAGAFERAVSVAASLVELAAARGELIRLVSSGSAIIPTSDSVPGSNRPNRPNRPNEQASPTGSGDSGFVSARERLDPLMDRLAAVSAAPDRAPRRTGAADPLVETVRQLAAGATGRLVICTGDLDDSSRAELVRVSSRFGLRVMVSTSADSAVSAVPARSDAGLVAMHWDGRTALDQAWREQVASAVAGATAGAGARAATR